MQSLFWHVVLAAESFPEHFNIYFSLFVILLSIWHTIT